MKRVYNTVSKEDLLPAGFELLDILSDCHPNRLPEHLDLLMTEPKFSEHAMEQSVFENLACSALLAYGQDGLKALHAVARKGTHIRLALHAFNTLFSLVQYADEEFAPGCSWSEYYLDAEHCERLDAAVNGTYADPQCSERAVTLIHRLFQSYLADPSHHPRPRSLAQVL